MVSRWQRRQMFKRLRKRPPVRLEIYYLVHEIPYRTVPYGTGAEFGWDFVRAWYCRIVRSTPYRTAPWNNNLIKILNSLFSYKLIIGYYPSCKIWYISSPFVRREMRSCQWGKGERGKTGKWKFGGKMGMGGVLDHKDSLVILSSRELYIFYNYL
jgi:hypothetical protein